ncbi:hypothetical protein Salat_1880900 [Sesamum alatum]|uniref:Uncharacterized protein n=1 Tax=Sesamum alatum TaxID=300844 RepID=A0AAE1Y4I7_9LAMI|nr:hypothetical protein Salat_1880900 [Sesamum alatum]
MIKGKIRSNLPKLASHVLFRFAFFRRKCSACFRKLHEKNKQIQKKSRKGGILHMGRKKNARRGISNEGDFSLGISSGGDFSGGGSVSGVIGGGGRFRIMVL